MKTITLALIVLMNIPGSAGAKDLTTQKTDHTTFIGQSNFKSLYYLMNRLAWPNLTKDGHELRYGLTKIALCEPIEITIINNGWHLPMTGSDYEDIRYKDMKKHILVDNVMFTNALPKYDTPGFIAIIKSKDGNLILAARINNAFLLEDRSGVGVVYDK